MLKGADDILYFCSRIYCRDLRIFVFDQVRNVGNDFSEPQKPDFTFYSAASFVYDRVSLSPTNLGDNAVSILDVTAYKRVYLLVDSVSAPTYL